MSRFTLYRNVIRSFVDAELSTVRKVIADYSRIKHQATPDEALNDGIFTHRLNYYPKSLKMNFWESHFEWQALMNYAKPGESILDFGCGSGHSDILLARNGFTVHGVDLSGLAIRIANKLLESEREEVRNRLSFSKTDVLEHLPPNDKKYDVIWASHVFEHLVEAESLISKLLLWLKPGGQFYISVPFGDAYSDPGHIQKFFSVDELSMFLGPELMLKSFEHNKKHDVLRAQYTAKMGT